MKSDPCPAPGCNQLAGTNGWCQYHKPQTGPGLWTAYRAHLEATGKRPRTITMYRNHLYNFWGHCGKIDHPGTVTRKDLQDYLARTSTGPRSRGQRISRNTVVNDGQHIRAAYRWWIAEGLLPRKSPIANFALPKGVQGPPRSIPVEQIGRLLDAAEETNPRVATMLHLAWGCGLRAGEIAGARIEDLAPSYGAHRLELLVRGKGGRDRVVPIPEPTADWLDRFLADRPPTGPIIESARPFDGQGKPLAPANVSRQAGDFMRAHGVKASLHSLRHSYATTLLRASGGTTGGLRAVQRLVGHASSKTTERYTSAWDGEAWDVAALLPDARAVR